LGRIIDEVNHRYGRLIVLKQAGRDKHKQALWLCRCDCGNEITVRGSGLRGGHTQSCGCLSLKNDVGKRYGRLTVLEQIKSRRGGASWLCRCECGNKVTVHGSDLRRGGTQSCGCLWKEKTMLPSGDAAFNALLYSIKRAAKKRGYSWNLMSEQVKQLTSQVCHYCGAGPAQVSHGASYNGVYVYNGLDRINNEKGYALENVIPCCKVCNYAKRTMTQDDFLAWISRVYMYSVNKG